MKKQYLTAFLFLLVLAGIFGRFSGLKHIFAKGTRVLIPVVAQSEKSNGFPYKIRLRYFNVLPPFETQGLSGTAVVRRDDSEKIEFVRAYDDSLPLRPKEMRLRWRIGRAFGTQAGLLGAQVNFAADELPVFSPETVALFAECVHKADVRYAVVRVGKYGTPVLVGLADKNGALLSVSEK